MTREQYDYCVKVYHDVVLTQVLDVPALRTAVRYIQGADNPIQPLQARNIVYSWYNHQREKFLAAFEEVLEDTQTSIDFTETTAPPVDPPKEEQSHSEEVSHLKQEGSAEEHFEKKEYNSEWEYLQKELESLPDIPENKRKRATLKMRITKIKNKFDAKV